MSEPFVARVQATRSRVARFLGVVESLGDDHLVIWLRVYRVLTSLDPAPLPWKTSSCPHSEILAEAKEIQAEVLALVRENARLAPALDATCHGRVLLTS
jgi:hypothetical protein